MANKDSGTHKRPIEAYQHTQHERLNNPPVGLVTSFTDPDAGKKKYAYDPHLDPQLVWAGKAEHTSFEVPTVSLHVHERIDPCTIIGAVRKRNGEPVHQHSLFEQEEKPLRQAIEFYKHKENWTNRLIAGDSLLVMNSLLEKEGMAGKVQMIYIDPPYGIKYGSNFQPFVNRRDVKDGKDEDLTAEPEQVRAFRDTWELGIHSYLTYLRDRLLLARELLTESGSVFVQIGDENVHHVRELMDEVFGSANFAQIIPFRKKLMPLGAKLLEGMCDYLLWYAKDVSLVKYRPLFQPTKPRWLARWTNVELPDGTRRRLTTEESDSLGSLPAGAKVYRLVSQRAPSFSEASVYNFTFHGKVFNPPSGGCWVTTKERMQRLADCNRLEAEADNLSYVYYHDDFPYSKVTNYWDDTSPVQGKVYVVQTTERVIERCLLMTTDPGDLVFDPTCGSGTTAYVAEQWGRRWITCDTSRVAITITRQRLMTAAFDYYELAHPEEGISGGLKYRTVPHVALRSIAQNAEIDQISAEYQPRIDKALATLNESLSRNWEEWEVPNLCPHPLWPDKVRHAYEFLSQHRSSGEALEGGIDSQSIQLALNDLNEYLGSQYTLEDLPQPIPSEDWPQAAKDAIRRFWAIKRKKQEEIDASIQRHAPQETLYDQPFVDRSKIRVTGPFTVEAVPAPVVKSVDEILSGEPPAADASVTRSGETLRQAEWRDELYKTGVRGKGGQYIRFARLEPLPGCRWLHADGETRPSDKAVERSSESASVRSTTRVVVSFGPEYAPLERRQVELALEEAQHLIPKPGLVIFAAFQFDPEAAKDIDEINWPGVTLLKVQMNADLLTEDLKKKRASNESFWLIGQPDVQVERIKEGSDKGKYRVSVHGFDYYNTKTGNIESGGEDKIAVWLLDTDYDGRSLFPQQVFFPMAGPDDGWTKLARSLRAEIDQDLIEAYRGTVSLPFEAGEYRRIAVKIVDDRGIESLKVVKLD